MKNLKMVQSLGADYVIDYKENNFAENGKKYDLIFAANGNQGFFEYNNSLSKNGILVIAKH